MTLLARVLVEIITIGILIALGLGVMQALADRGVKFGWLYRLFGVPQLFAYLKIKRGKK